MKLFKFNSDSEIYVNESKYKINWDRKVSKPQKAVKDFLRQFWEKDLVLEEFCIPGSKKRIDLMNCTKSIVIEVSPESIHSKYNDFIHKTRSAFLLKIKADNDKLIWAEKNNFTFISLNNSDIKNISEELFKNKFGINIRY